MKIVREYRQPPAVVWRALTDPALVPLWTSTGQGGRPEGFKTEVGTRFRYVGKPFPGWDGIVRCEVLAVEETALLRYSWRNKEADEPTLVTNTLERLPGGGTRLTWEHTGFRGIEGAVMSRVLGRVRRRMLDEGVPKVLDDLDETRNIRGWTQTLKLKMASRRDPPRPCPPGHRPRTSAAMFHGRQSRATQYPQPWDYRTETSC